MDKENKFRVKLALAVAVFMAGILLLVLYWSDVVYRGVFSALASLDFLYIVYIIYKYRSVKRTVYDSSWQTEE